MVAGMLTVGVTVMLVLTSSGVRFMVALLLSMPAMYLGGWVLLLTGRAWVHRRDERRS
jgi:hypothetical protein